MRLQTISSSRICLRNIFNKFFLILALSSVNFSKSEGTRDSIANRRSIKNYEEVSVVPNDSKNLNIEQDVSRSPGENRNQNSPALDSFLKNVLRAQDELKWIDRAVRRRIETKESREKIPARYLRSYSHIPASRFRSKIRFKRRSSPRTDHDQFWKQSKRIENYYDDDDSGRIYLDDEMKVKRYANPYADFEKRGYRSLRKKQERSVFEDGEPVDDSISEFEKFGGDPADRFSPNLRTDDWFENSRDGREVRSSSDIKIAEEPSLESLKKTVLELRKSLEDSDKKMDALNGRETIYRGSENRERNVEDISGGKESGGKGEREREIPKNDKKSEINSRYDLGLNSYEENEREDQDESISGSNWWDDTRSAADIFDFKKRSDDVEDDEDNDEDSESVNSDFDDYVMKRVKRERENDRGGKRKVRVYRRSGFGELYPEKKYVYEENPEDMAGSTKAGGRVYREIREDEAFGGDKINEGNNFYAVERSGDSKSVGINADENGNGHSEVKNIPDDNEETEKSSVLKIVKNVTRENSAGTIGDSNLKDTNKLEFFLSRDEKRSASLRDAEDEREQGFSAGDLIRKNLKSRADEPLKNAPIESVDDNISHEKNTVRNIEGRKDEEKSEVKVQDEQIKTNNAKLAGSERSDENEVKIDSDDENGLKIDVKKNESSKTAEIFEPQSSDGGIKNGEKSKTEFESKNEAKQVDLKSCEKGIRNFESKEKNPFSKRDDSTRKLLWLSEKSTAKDVEIRDGRRDSSWDQNRGEKSGQRPANYLKNVFQNEDEDYKFEDKSNQLKKRSLKFYPENIGEDNDREKIISYKKVPDLIENVYEIEDDRVSQDDEDLKNPGVENEDEESDRRRSHSSVNHFSNQDGERDPIRDRINMLIKQKLDDRGKGRSMHYKREADRPVANIEYYDYDNDINASDSDADSMRIENDPQQRAENRDNTTFPQVAIDAAPESLIITDKNADKERKEELEKEEEKKHPEKQEFISDIELGKNGNTKPPFSKNGDGGSAENIFKENGANDQSSKSNNHWLGQPVEVDPPESRDAVDREYRYQDIGEPVENEKTLENEKGEFLGGPLEYSINVRGKLDPESIDDTINQRENSKEKEFRDGNEKRNDKLQIENDLSRSGNDDEYEDEQFGSNWRYRADSARIEEGTNGQGSSLKSFSHKLGETKNNEDLTSSSSREARLVDDQDSLPTMLDRSGPRNLAPGERTYLVIAPAQPRKKNEKNSSSSGSNYLALKITDDMFKGGVEQSNPIEDQVSEDNFMGGTTTEWKVVKMQGDDNARVEPNFENVKMDSNSEYDAEDESKSLQDLVINPRDVAHESIVDPEEMDGDFDDDTRPRFRRDLKCVRKFRRHFGRSLQSVTSYPINSIEQIHKDFGEKPADKYMENSQNGFRNLSQGKAENLVEIKIDHQNLTGKIYAQNLEKRSFGFETIFDTNGDNETDVDDDKRGLTNVQEWEMNPPEVQKQRIISNPPFSQGHFGDKDQDSKKNKLQSTRKIFLANFYDTSNNGVHERESRSVEFGKENFESDENSPGHELHSGDKKRAKNRSKTKFHTSNLISRLKPFDSSFESKSRNNYDKIRYDNEFGKLNRKSETDGYWRRKSENKENLSNHRNHQHSYIKKHRNDNKEFKSKEITSHGFRESLRDSTDSKNPLKNVKAHGENNFKEVRGNSVMHRGKFHNKIAAGAIGHSHIPLQSKSETEREGEGYGAGNVGEYDKRVLDENAEDSSTVKSHIDDTQKKKITVLLAADNMEDESQMDLALHGELAGKIVERIFDQVQKNDALKTALGPGLYRKHKSEDAIASDKVYRQGLDEDEVKHTEGMMRRVMELLGRLILDEVQRKTCASLPPDMREFLQWMLGVEDEDKADDQIPPLPLVRNQEPNHRQDDKFLFENHLNQKEDEDVDEINKKIKLLRGLINEYNSLSDKEKTQVEIVRDYLEKQLQLLLNCIEGKETEDGKRLEGGGIGPGNILQYQNAVPNANGTLIPESTLSPLVNTPSILMLSNASFVEQRPTSNGHLARSRFREIRSSEDDEIAKKHKKRKHRKHKHQNSKHRDRRKHKHNKHAKKKNRNKNKKKKKKNKNHQRKKQKGTESPEYKKLIRRADMLRKKRANLYEDHWDPLDSGYEEPTIYTLSEKVDDERRNEFFKNKFEKSKNRKFFGDKRKSDKEIKRDVSSASIALQPWTNPKLDDLVSSNYFDKFTNELVQGSSIPPVYPGGNIIENEKPDSGMTEGRNLADDEVMLLRKREAWKEENEQQLEEVAFGKDMRGKWKEKEEFQKLTEMDRKKNSEDDSKRKKRDEGNKTFVLNNSEEEDEVSKVKNSKNETGVKSLSDLTPDSKDSKNFPNSSSGALESAIKNEKSEDLSARSKTEDRSSRKNNFSDLIKNERKFPHRVSTEPFENRKNKRSSFAMTPELGGPAILPLLEISEQRDQQKQAAKTEKDDQRDIADQMLGLESSLMGGLNTY